MINGYKIIKKKFNEGQKRLKIFKKDKKGPIYVKRAKPKKEFEKIRKIVKRGKKIEYARDNEVLK